MRQSVGLRWPRRAWLGLTALAVMSVVVTAQDQAPTFRASTRTVPIYATVTDSEGRLVPNLTIDDFEIRDDGRSQTITLFVNEVQPITVIVMLDTSASMTGNLKLLYNAAEQFLMRLLPDDRGRVGAFNDKIQIVGQFTGDRDSLIASLQELDFGNPTRLHDAVYFGLDELKDIEGRRVVLVFSDGDDTDSRLGSREVLDRARLDEVMVYSIGLESEYFNGVRQVRSRPDRSLRRLAEETGGGYFELRHTDELAPTFTRVAQELHSQYVLGFTPAELDGEVHDLDVRVKRPGMTARARRSYVANDEN